MFVIILLIFYQELQVMLAKSWETHEGQICTGVHWELFTGPDQAKVLFCINGSSYGNSNWSFTK